MFHLCFLLGVLWFLVLTFRSLAHFEPSLEKQKRKTSCFLLVSLFSPFWTFSWKTKEENQLFSSCLSCHRSKRDSVYTDTPSYPGLPSPGQLGSSRSDHLDDGDDTTTTNNDSLLCIRHYPNRFTNIASFNPSTTWCETWLYYSCFAVIKGEVIR